MLSPEGSTSRLGGIVDDDALIAFPLEDCGGVSASLGVIEIVMAYANMAGDSLDKRPEFGDVVAGTSNDSIIGSSV